ncbi:lasso peptide biosynthesis B2 protein [Streptomyces parvus]|uniref:lasso peptide biosynthesis B2 protein n=1 Tax=Streptomyces parvus TaxID=66428 RepID=UPI0035D99649
MFRRRVSREACEQPKLLLGPRPHFGGDQPSAAGRTRQLVALARGRGQPHGDDHRGLGTGHTFLLATRRLSVVWCHGIAADPVRLHAWVQTVDGGLVAEPPSTRAYTPALTIGARHQHRL